MNMKNIKPTLVLSTICLVVALLLAGVNLITAPIIEEAKTAAESAALAEVLPGATNFKPIALTDKYPSVVKKGYSADGGYVFTMQVVGYKDGLEIICGVTADGKIAGVKHLQSNETYGLEEELNTVYIGDSSENIELVIASGASKNSKTSKAYYEAVKAALDAAIVAGGGEVDLRTPEQIMSDNCNAALGTEGLTFKKWFATEILDGIDAVYESEGGRVFVIGDVFIGIKADGSVVAPEGTAEESLAAANAANTLVSTSNPTEITKPEGTKDSVKKISVTESGNYVFELTANGYQALVDWGNGTPIKIKLSISADGKIIDVLTVSHGESSGYGDICATDEYYAAYKGKGDEDIKISISGTPDYHEDLITNDNTDIGAISSATYTTYGYQKAVKDAFAAYELLKGGNQ